MAQAMLVVFGGRPGTGKTTIAKALAVQRSAVFLRIDTIEQAIRSSVSIGGAIGAAGYEVAQALAVENLKLGHTVLADCVNPVEDSRRGWRAAAVLANCPLLEVELICSDSAEHRRRVESRLPDIEGHSQPSWSDVLARPYSPWPEPHLVIDTALVSATAAVDIIVRHMTDGR